MITLESNFRQINPGRLLGNCTAFGGNFHVEALRIRWDDTEGQQTWQAELDQEDFETNDEILCDLYRLDPEGPFTTVEIPGFEGEWVLFMYPFKD